MGSRPRYYLDTCVFIAWIKQEQRLFQEMAGIESLINQVEKKQVTLVASTILFTELLFTKMPNKSIQFNDLLGKSNIAFLPVDLPIARLAGEIRAHYASIGKISVPDALHLATAIYGRCERFYTFDDGKKGDHGLLKLGNQVAGYPLTVTKPFSPEQPLPGIDG